MITGAGNNKKKGKVTVFSKKPKTIGKNSQSDLSPVTSTLTNKYVMPPK